MISPCEASLRRYPIDTVIGMDLKLPAASPGALLNVGAAESLTATEGATNFATGLASAMNLAPSGGSSSPMASLLPVAQPAAAAASGSPTPPVDMPVALGALASLFASIPLNVAQPAQAKPFAATATGAAPAPAETPTLGLLAALVAATTSASQPAVDAQSDTQGDALPTSAAATPGDERERSNPNDLLGLLMTMNLQPAPPPSPATPQTQAASTLPSVVTAAITNANAASTNAASANAPGTAAAFSPRAVPATAPVLLNGQGGSSSPLASLMAAATPVAPDAGAAAQFMDSIAAPLGIDSASSSSPASLRAVADVVLGVSSLQAPAADRSAAPTLPLAPLDIRQPQAPQRLADSVVWHLDQGLQEVHIRLNPEELGPLEVKLRTDGEKVAVRFDMADASVRDVVQTSLPNLASLLSARGLMLDQAQVFSQGQGQTQHPSGFAEFTEAQGEETPAAPRAVSRRGLIDDYV